MPSGPATKNRFLTAPIGRLFLSNALPMILVMSMGGLLNLVDAVFLGHFVGAEALTAVSLVFPILMITFAVSTLVGGGMTSLLARQLGAADKEAGGATFARAHGLALCIALVMIIVYLAVGPGLIKQLSGADSAVTRMAHLYLLIVIFGTPLQFLLGLHADALRIEGRAGTIGMLSVGVTLANIVLNYLLIVTFEFGVAGSAWGSVIAQGIGLALVVRLRLKSETLLQMATLVRHRWIGGWIPIIKLGAPLSLSFIGMALVSATIITTLRLTAEAGYADTIAAYGVVTRIVGFAYLPQMAIGLAMQAIVGNNFGAGLYQRSNSALLMAVGAVFAYCLIVALGLFATNATLGAGFSDDPVVVAQVGTIIRAMFALYVVAGPILVLALYFQAIGQPWRTAALTLAKPFVLTPLLVVALVTLIGPGSLWLAFPAADGLLAVIALAIVLRTLAHGSSQTGFGVSETSAKA